MASARASGRKTSFCEQKEAEKLFCAWVMGNGCDNAQQKRRFVQKAAIFIADNLEHE
jgi:hypothetical protein